jgi:hypothetical protein
MWLLQSCVAWVRVSTRALKPCRMPNAAGMLNAGTSSVRQWFTVHLP